MKPPAALMETAIYSDDLDAAEAFYRDVFGLEVVRKLPGQFVFFKCGRQMLLVFDPQQSRKATPDNLIRATARSGKAIFAFTRKTSRKWTTGRHASKNLALPSNIITVGRTTAIPSTYATRRAIPLRWVKASCGGSNSVAEPPLPQL